MGPDKAEEARESERAYELASADVVLPLTNVEADRIAQARRELGSIADALFNTNFGSKKDERHDIGRRLNAANVVLRTLTLKIEEERHG
jgi:hypothetical protein